MIWIDLVLKALCSASPRKLKAITVKNIKNPGQMASFGSSYIKSCAPVSILPQLAVGGWIPRPRKLNTLSNRMIFPTVNVVATIIGEVTFGNICLDIMRDGLKP
jgi:hypothetical protein